LLASTQTARTCFPCADIVFAHLSWCGRAKARDGIASLAQASCLWGQRGFQPALKD